MNCKNSAYLLALSLTSLLAGCGAGGGGGADSYTITLRADRTALPLNIGHVGPSLGGQYTTTLYVDAKDHLGQPIPGGTEVFGCGIVGGLDSGPLYYLDGDPDHETTKTVNGVEVTTPNAYRSVTLGSNAGGASFHFHASDVVGPVTVRCTVTDPGSTIQREAAVTIQVGGSPSGKVSQTLFNQANPAFLVVQGAGGPTQVQLQAQLVDEAGQPIANPAGGANNLQVRLVPDAATPVEDDASLRGVNGAGQAVAGSAIQIASINGQAQLTLVSGSHSGTILVEAIADRSDNDVGNGIAEPVYNYTAMTVVTTVPVAPTAITIATATLPAAASNIPYGALLQATDGTPPYTWSLVSAGLPSGLTLAPNGIISGLPMTSVSGTYPFVVQVSDAQGATGQKQFTIAYTYTAPPAPTPPATLVVTPATVTAPLASSPLTFVVSGGSPTYVATSNNGAVATTGAVTQSGGQYRFTATLLAAGSTTLVVTDGSGQVKTVTLTVTP